MSNTATIPGLSHIQLQAILLAIEQTAPDRFITDSAFKLGERGVLEFRGTLNDDSVVEACVKNPLTNARVVELTHTPKGGSLSGHRYPFYLHKGNVIVPKWFELTKVQSYQMESGLKWPGGKKPYNSLLLATVATLSFVTTLCVVWFIGVIIFPPSTLMPVYLASMGSIAATVISNVSVRHLKEKLTLSKWKKYSRGLQPQSGVWK